MRIVGLGLCENLTNNSIPVPTFPEVPGHGARLVCCQYAKDPQS